jgi:hypothetical protein
MGHLDEKLIKKAHSKVKYNQKMFDELEACMHPETGPMYYMENFMYIQHPIQGRLKFAPFDYQRDLTHVYHNYRNAIAMIGRQLGKTTLAAGYLLWYAMFIPDSTILIAAHKREGANEIMQRIRYCYENTPDHIRAGGVEYNKGNITFDNGSRILAQATTENTGRGLSLSLVYLDEFAFVPPRIAREFWTSLSPTLSTGGKCIITSTPNVDDDQFAEIWFASQKTTDEYGNISEVGTNGFKGYYANWRAHPDRDEAWAAVERSKIGDERFRREHECEFISFTETLISPAKLTQLSGSGIMPIKKTGQVRWYDKIRNGRTYCVSLDPSMGTGGDNAAIEVMEIPSMKQVAEWQHNRSLVEEQVKTLRAVLLEIQNEAPDSEIYWTIESNTLGEAALVVIRDTGEERFPGTFMHDPNRNIANKNKRKGYLTTNKTKLEACAKLKTLVEHDKIQIKSKNLIHELKYFIAKGESYEANIGETDDLISALLIIIRMVQHIATWDNNVQDAINSNVGGAFEEEGEAPLPLLI